MLVFFCFFLLICHFKEGTDKPTMLCNEAMNVFISEILKQHMCRGLNYVPIFIVLPTVLILIIIFLFRSGGGVRSTRQRRSVT